MDPVAISMTLFKGGFALASMIQRKRLLKELRNEGDLADENFRKLILTEIDNCSLKLDKQSRNRLKASLSFYKEGLANMNEVLNDVAIAKKGANTATPERPERAGLGRGIFYTDDNLTPTTEDLRALNQADLNESLRAALQQARESFIAASMEATHAFIDSNLYASERVHAMYIRVMGKILQNMEHPERSLPSCRAYLEELYNMQKIKNVFCDAQGRKSSLRKEEDIEIFVGVCCLHRIIYDYVAKIDPLQRGHWTLPCITIKEGEVIHLIDPLRDARVAKALCMLPEEWKQNLLFNVADLSMAWSFGNDGNGKLISPQDVCTNPEGQFIVADDGDCTIKVFHESGEFLNSFHPIARNLSDEDLVSVTTDHEKNVLVLIRMDKYHHVIYTISSDKTFKFPLLKEGCVRCAPIVDQNGDVLVVIEEKESKCSAVEVYDANGRLRRLYGQGILEEPKDMTFDDEHRLMVLNGNNRVVLFNEQGKHLEDEGFEVVPSEAIAFNPISKQVVVSSSNTSGLGRRVKISMYDEKRICVRCIHQDEEKREKEEKGGVPPKIAVTKDGRIATLAGIVGDSKVIVV